MIMKYFFLTIAVVALISGLCGNHHLFAITVMSLIMTIAIHYDDKKVKKGKADFFD